MYENFFAPLRVPTALLAAAQVAIRSLDAK
jgi:hypothetical protein